MAAITRYLQPRVLLLLSEAKEWPRREACAWLRFFGEGVPTRFAMASNLFETKEGYILQMVLPAVKLAELEMTVHQNVLTVRGKRELAIPAGARGIWVGLTGGAFREEVTLPGAVEAVQAQATYEDGILTVTLPRAAQAKVKSITIAAAA
jgi:HSP20 family protein